MTDSGRAPATRSLRRAMPGLAARRRIRPFLYVPNSVHCGGGVSILRYFKEAAGNARLLPVETGALLPPRTWVEEITALSTSENEADTEPERVLALGGGIRAREDIGLFRRMSGAMGAALMCSRSLVERGWLPQSLQIGLSGRCIAPRLLVALGVSGSVQFLAGVQGAKKICAVNTDPNAPILRVADIPLICDLYQVAEAYGC